MQRDVLTFEVQCCRAEAKRLRKVISALQATLEDVTAQREWEDLPSRWEARHAACPASHAAHCSRKLVHTAASLLLLVASLLAARCTPESHAFLSVWSSFRN